MDYRNTGFKSRLRAPLSMQHRLSPSSRNRRTSAPPRSSATGSATLGVIDASALAGISVAPSSLA